MVWAGVIKTVAGIVLAPRLGCRARAVSDAARVVAFVRFTPLRWTVFSAGLQFVSASFYALGHGGNDAQKTMGIIAVLLYSQGYMGAGFHVPFWVV